MDFVTFTISNYLNKTLEALPIPDIVKPLAYAVSSQIHGLKGFGKIAAMTSQAGIVGWLGMILMFWLVITSIYSMLKGFVRWMWLMVRMLLIVAAILGVLNQLGYFNFAQIYKLLI